MNVTAHRDKMEEMKKGMKKAGKGEDRRPILEKLCAALLRSFRGQHGKKCFKRREMAQLDATDSMPTPLVHNNLKV